MKLLIFCRATCVSKSKIFQEMYKILIESMKKALRNTNCTKHDLTHWGRVTHICVGKLTIIGSDNDLSPSQAAPSHYLNQCWNIVNLTLGNKLQWNFNRNWNILIPENAFEYIVCEMASILSRPQCVKCVRRVTRVWIPYSTNRLQSISWTNNCLVYWGTYAPFAIDE